MSRQVSRGSAGEYQAPQEGREPERGNHAKPGRPSPSATGIALQSLWRPTAVHPWSSSLPVSVSLSPRLCLSVSVSPSVSLTAVLLSFSTMGQEMVAPLFPKFSVLPVQVLTESVQ